MMHDWSTCSCRSQGYSLVGVEQIPGKLASGELEGVHGVSYHSSLVFASRSRLDRGPTNEPQHKLTTYVEALQNSRDCKLSYQIL